MEINPEIRSILKSCKIHVDYGLLYLLSLYYDIDGRGAIPEEVFRKVNLSKIIDKDHSTNTVTWNVPLFAGQESGSFSWVSEWMSPFGVIGGPAKLGTHREVMRRMKEWFAKNPEYRKEDVYAARDLYFRTEKPVGQYVKTSHKFIYEGTGHMKTSMLLLWCERNKKLKDSSTSTANPLMKGKLL